MFHLRDQNFIVGVHVSAAPSIPHEVYRFSGITYEDDALGRGSVDEARDFRTGLFIRRRRLLT